MKFEPLEHRSDDWHKTRLGMPTASQFHRIVTPGGKARIPARSKSAEAYMAELIAEKIFGYSMQKDISDLPAVRWGNQYEPEAAGMLADILAGEGATLAPGGFFSDDRERYGASPDRIVISGNKRELVEIKCPYLIPNHVANLLFDDDDHRVQMQGQLMVSGYDAVHFFSYHPLCPPHHQVVKRDNDFIAGMRKIIEQFCDELVVERSRARKMGEWKVEP